MITTYVLEETRVTFVMSRDDVLADGRLDDEFGGALWLQSDAFATDEFREAWDKLDV